ncbi:hypothetical protein [Spiroplasma sp. SV19]|uniref:hypothetical protein n=1 Tax=Spiroplasma sp. SV19 TaxID=2570468 RepID=UPI0024B6698A|nr:hypothetical protein [Spiroplasma sp. SV19]WHQ37095.1 hypothetical protein E7Y35_04270 [Spiroplasma sp. SV19]
MNTTLRMQYSNFENGVCTADDIQNCVCLNSMLYRALKICEQEITEKDELIATQNKIIGNYVTTERYWFDMFNKVNVKYIKLSNKEYQQSKSQLSKADFFKACPYSDIEKLPGQFICENCRSPKEFQDAETRLDSNSFHMYEWIVKSDALAKIDNLPEGEHANEEILKKIE